jgi:single-strand DNA-binding protein
LVPRPRSGDSTNGDTHVPEQSNPHRLPRQQRRSSHQQQPQLHHLSLATKSSYKKDGKYISHTEWHRCVVFGKLSEFARTLTKGAHIQVEGELRSREYDSKKTDTKQRIWEIRVASILKLDRAEKAAPEEQEQHETSPRRKRPHKASFFTSRKPG